MIITAIGQTSVFLGLTVLIILGMILARLFFQRWDRKNIKVWLEAEAPWEGEKCQACGQPYSYVWSAPNEMWNQVVGKGGAGFLCIPCFDKLCVKKGKVPYWTCGY